MRLRKTKVLFALALTALTGAAFAQVPPKASEALLVPGKAIASTDDASAILVNPANLAFSPGAELRWEHVSLRDASRLPGKGHAFSFAFPFFNLATGLRLDLVDPPRGAPFVSNYRWLRWGLSAKAGESLGIGTTLAWSYSDAPALDDYVSATTSLTLRPSAFLSLAAVARDWNAPESQAGFRIERSYDLGLAIRPLGGRRALEVGLEAEHYATSDEWVPRATLGIDVPRLGRLRGDVTLVDPGGSARFVASAGLDLHLGGLELSGGGIFGDALPEGGGYFAGAAIRGFREPGVRFPARVVRVKVDGTPGVRAHFRLLRRLWRLADDPEVEGVALVLRSEPAGSLARAEEVADAVRLLRQKGKKVMCHLEDAGGRSLYVCAQANKVAMNPAGGLRFAGLSSTYFYFGGLLDKLGIKSQFVRIGEHKLAAEQFTLRRGTDIARIDRQELLEELERIYLLGIASGRKMTPAELDQRLAKGPFIAPEARAAGLVDVLAYDDQIDRAMSELMGKPVRLTDERADDRAPDAFGEQDRVAVVYLAGDMVDGESQTIPILNVHLAGSYTIAGALKRVREDPRVKAVVFRIETGGGSSLAADVILREAVLTAREKPLVVSMGSAAASGGYYVSVAGRTIFANRATITGSIGIFYGKVDVSGLMNTLGVGIEQFRTAPRADAESLFRPFTDDEKNELGRKVKQFYDLFVGRVAEGRGMTAEQVDAVARGKVWTGGQAKPIGLVDRIGGLREAVAEARRLGGLPDDAPFVELPEERDPLLGFVLDLIGLKANAGGALPPALAGLGRLLAPFVAMDPSKPQARVEILEDEAPGGPLGRLTTPEEAP